MLYGFIKIKGCCLLYRSFSTLSIFWRFFWTVKSNFFLAFKILIWNQIRRLFFILNINFGAHHHFSESWYSLFLFLFYAVLFQVIWLRHFFSTEQFLVSIKFSKEFSWLSFSFVEEIWQSGFILLSMRIFGKKIKFHSYKIGRISLMK